jgi:hypothetical protein
VHLRGQRLCSPAVVGAGRQARSSLLLQSSWRGWLRSRRRLQTSRCSSERPRVFDFEANDGRTAAEGNADGRARAPGGHDPNEHGCIGSRRDGTCDHQDGQRSGLGEDSTHCRRTPF